MKFTHFKHVNQLRFCLVPTYDISIDISTEPFTLRIFKDGTQVVVFFTVKSLFRWLLYKQGAAWMIERGLIVPGNSSDK